MADNNKTPDFSFQQNPAILQAYANAAQQHQQAQRLQFEQQQAGIRNAQQAAEFASQTIESFVEKSKQRQQRDAVAAFVAFNPNKPTLTTNAQGEESMTPYGTTPQGQDEQRKLLARVAATNSPQASQDIIAAKFPKPATTLEGLAARALAAGQTVDPKIAETKHELAKPANGQSKSYLYKGQPSVVDFDPSKKQYSIGGQPISALDLSPMPTGGADNARVREELGMQQARERFVKSVDPSLFTQGSTAGVAARVVAAGDNFLNQVDRIKSGEVVMDKTTAHALMTEADRVLTGTGQVSEKREEGLMPASLRGKVADIQTWLTNEPTGRDQQTFLYNLAKEIKSQRDQKNQIINQAIAPALAAGKLIREKDPETWTNSLKSIGLDPEAARTGKVKFLPNVNSLFYGEGYDDRGKKVDANAPDKTKEALDTLRQMLKKKS